MALRLSPEPGPVVQAGSLRRALQRVARLAAEAHDTAHGELLPQADPVHGNARVSAQAGGVTCKKTKQLRSAGGHTSSKFKVSKFGEVGNTFTDQFTISKTKVLLKGNYKTAAVPPLISRGAGQHEFSSSCLRKSVKPL